MRHIKDCINRIKEQKTIVLPVGMKFLDDNLGGLYPGEMTVICGDADDGKTALMIRQIHRLAFEGEIPVMIVLNGMSERTFLACMAGFYCSIITNDIHQVYSESVCKDDVEAYWNILEKKPVYFVDSKELSGKALDTFKQTVSENGIKAIFFEQASCMRIHGWKSAKLGFYLKQLANDLQVAVIAEYEFWLGEGDYPLRVQLFENDHFSNFADNIIGIMDFANHCVYEDEKGNDLRGCVRLKIMKHKGVVSSGKEIIFRKILLFCRSKKYATMFDASKIIDSNPGIKKFMDELDCVIDDPLDCLH